MLARTLLDRHYGDFDALLFALADLLAQQIADLDCACIQVDEANVTGNPEHGPLAAEAINRLLDAVQGQKAVAKPSPR
jgi:5-methyltetrahydropteroyltriglutamate--homocysteine methyltransferase